MKLYPIIESDGSISEVKLKDNEAMDKIKIVNPINYSLSKITDTEVNISWGTYKKENFFFASSECKGSVNLFVYVSDRFLSRDFMRQEKLNRLAKDLAPWLFSYAERRYNE